MDYNPDYYNQPDYYYVVTSRGERGDVTRLPPFSRTRPVRILSRRSTPQERRMALTFRLQHRKRASNIVIMDSGHQYIRCRRLVKKVQHGDRHIPIHTRPRGGPADWIMIGLL